MRIAFVGKGGSGKTTIAALFTHYLVNKNKKVLAIDGDINMHMGELLGFEEQIPVNKQISTPVVADTIKSYLIGNNKRIKEISDFKKTTPPTKDSNFLFLSDSNNQILRNFSISKGNLYFMAVGTYDSETIGTACYHNNLAVFESLLSHTIDGDEYIVVDMVAGTDAFANTLHAQFDLLVLVIEPTKKGLEVFRQYYDLAKSAGIEKSVVVIGNKIRGEEDKKFLKSSIPDWLLLGFFSDSAYLRRFEQLGGKLNIDLLEKENYELIGELFRKFSSIKPDRKKRLEKLWDLHVKYVSQDYIKTSSGDLTNQIDRSFDPEKVIARKTI